MVPKVRYPFLDGIRGWSAMVIVWYHVFVYRFPIVSLFGRPEDIFERFAFCKVSVWVFFVISGFALSIGFCQSRNRDALMRILYGRYLRLMIPIFAASLLVYLQTSLHASDIFSGLTIGQTLKFSLFDVYFNYETGDSLIKTLWTIQFEFIGSLIVLCLGLFFGRFKYRHAIYLLAFVLCLRVSYFLASFVVGLEMAELYTAGVLEKFGKYLTVGFALALGPLIYFGSSLPDEGGERAYLIIASALCFFLIFEPYGSRAMSRPFSRFLGKMSYSLYIIHGPVYALIKFRFDPEPNLLFDIFAIALAVGCAVLFYPADYYGLKFSRAFQERCLRAQKFIFGRLKAWPTLSASSTPSHSQNAVASGDC